MLKIFKKIKIIISRFKQNPITKNHLFKALINYLLFNIKCRLFNKVTYKGLKGVKFNIKKGDAGLVGNIYYGLYEFEDSIFLLHFLHETDMFIDVGANLGHFSIIASGIKKCRSFAIEPVPETYNRFQEQIVLNKLESKIVSLNIGLSDENKVLHFSNDKGTMNKVVDLNYKNLINVEVKTLDSILEIKRPTLMKIDVEGYEKFVFQGAKNILNNKNLKAIIIEFNNSGLKYKTSDEEVYNTLVALGFYPYIYDPFTRLLTKTKSYNTIQFNTLMIRDFEFVNSRINSASKIEIWDKLI